MNQQCARDLRVASRLIQRRGLAKGVLWDGYRFDICGAIRAAASTPIQVRDCLSSHWTRKQVWGRIFRAENEVAAVLGMAVEELYSWNDRREVNARLVVRVLTQAAANAAT